MLTVLQTLCTVLRKQINGIVPIKIEMYYMM